MYFPVPLNNHVLFTAILKNHVSEDTEVFVCDDYAIMENVACGCCFDFHVITFFLYLSPRFRGALVCYATL